MISLILLHISIISVHAYQLCTKLNQTCPDGFKCIKSPSGLFKKYECYPLVKTPGAACYKGQCAAGLECIIKDWIKRKRSTGICVVVDEKAYKPQAEVKEVPLEMNPFNDEPPKKSDLPVYAALGWASLNPLGVAKPPSIVYDDYDYENRRFKVADSEPRYAPDSKARYKPYEKESKQTVTRNQQFATEDSFESKSGQKDPYYPFFAPDPLPATSRKTDSYKSSIPDRNIAVESRTGGRTVTHNPFAPKPALEETKKKERPALYNPFAAVQNSPFVDEKHGTRKSVAFSGSVPNKGVTQSVPEPQAKVQTSSFGSGWSSLQTFHPQSSGQQAYDNPFDPQSEDMSNAWWKPSNTHYRRK